MQLREIYLLLRANFSAIESLSNSQPIFPTKFPCDQSVLLNFDIKLSTVSNIFYTFMNVSSPVRKIDLYQL